MYKNSFLLVCILLINPARGFALAQRVYPGVFLHDSTHCVVIDSVSPEGMFYTLGLKPGDCIYAINQKPVQTVKQFKEAVHDILEKNPMTLDVFTEGQRTTIETIAQGRLQNPYKKMTVIYSELLQEDCTLRTIEYIPKHGNHLPAILILPGYNCGTIESFSRSYYRELIKQWVENGFIVYSVEKSGVGDSEGCIPCEETDMQRDILIYTSALKKLKMDVQVDSNHVYLWGHSMGGIIAPIIAQQSKVKGIITMGTVFRPWHQFLPEMHEVQKPLLDHYSAEQTARFLDTITPLYHAFFVEKKNPSELVTIPMYKHLTETELEYQPGKTNMWGRHWRFWQQIDSLDLNHAWRSLHVPVLAIQGGADYIQCAMKEPKMLVEAVNEKDPDLARLVTIPDLDHLCMKSANYQEAVKNFEEKQYLKGNFHQGMADVIMAWLKEQEGN